MVTSGSALDWRPGLLHFVFVLLLVKGS